MLSNYTMYLRGITLKVLNGIWELYILILDEAEICK